ncbi:MAG: serine/threonine-protein kinase [Planctomycetales bacterium]
MCGSDCNGGAATILIKCPTCAAECTIDDASVETATCPSCGCLLRATSALTNVAQIDTSAHTDAWNPAAGPETADPAAVPSRIGRYQIRKLLAQGGFARVFLAHDDELDRPVALKLPRPERYVDRKTLLSVIQEARTAARLHHPGIVTIYDVAEQADAQPYIAMEYISGKSLRDLMSLGRLPFPRIADLMAQIAEAAHYAHGQGLVHRDLKPGNVLMDDRGHPKVVDFGLAIHESRQALLKGDAAGTPAYMAPEQVRGDTHRMDGRTDVWSLGVILYEMLSERRPFNGDRKQLFDEIQNRDPKPPRQIDDRIPEELEAICLRCLSKEVTGRYNTCLDLALALRSWMRRTDLPSSTSDMTRSHSGVVLSASDSPSLTRPVTTIPPRRHWRKPAVLIGLVAIVTSLGLLSLSGLLSHRNQARRPLQWHPLFDQPPVRLLWPEAAQDAVSSFTGGKPEVFVSTTLPSALVLDDSPAADFRVEVRISKSGAWVGKAGLFWGVHEGQAEDGTPSLRCQALYFSGSIQPDGAIDCRVNRDLLEFWTPPEGLAPLTSRHNYRSAQVSAPDNPEMLLQIEIVADRVHSVRWNGQSLPDVCDRFDPAALPPRWPLISRGRLGVYNETGATTFRDAKIQWLRSPPSQPEAQGAP